MPTYISQIQSNKNEKELILMYGISEKSIQDLLNYSKSDGEIKNFTNDEERFKDLETFLSWQKRGKDFYTLVDEKENLCGAIWFSDHSLPEYTILEPINISVSDNVPSFSIRIYENVRGKGYAENFIRETFKHYLENIRKDINQIWLGVSTDNPRGIHLYEKSGFVKIGESPEWNEYLMLYTPSQEIKAHDSTKLVNFT